MRRPARSGQIWEGLVPVIETAAPEDYGRYVHAKLQEELEEYLSSGDVAEIADLVEVCFAAAALHGVGQDELLAIARDKRKQCGGFDGRLVWPTAPPPFKPDKTKAMNDHGQLVRYAIIAGRKSTSRREFRVWVPVLPLRGSAGQRSRTV